MNPTDVLSTVSKALNNLGINYMLVGADAVNFYGRPRTTHDIDLKAAILPKDADKIYNILKGEFYVSKEAIYDAIRYKSMFNIIHNESGMKVDFWTLKDDEFELERFKRRKQVILFNIPMYIITPEDLIITKLDWYKESNSEKHYLDALGIYEVQRGKLDEHHIGLWVMHKSTKKIWERIKKEAIKE